MSTDSLQDPWVELRRMQERIARLETASPLENASISRNGIRAVIPGGNDDGDGATKYGHAGGKIGFLIRDDGEWVTVQEYATKRIVESHEYPTARITDVESRMTSAEAGINFTANRTTDLEGRVGPLEGRMSTAEGGITYTSNRVGDLEGRMSNAESSLNTKASTSTVNDLAVYARAIEQAGRNYMNGLNDRLNVIEGGTPKPGISPAPAHG